MQQDSTTPAPVRGAIFYSGKLLLFATVGAMLGSALSQLLLSLGLALGFASYWERRPLREVFRLRPLGVRGVVRAVVTGLCATVLVQVLGALAVILVERSGGKLPQYYNLTNTPFLVALLLLGIIPPVCEEMAYRGYLQQALGALGPRAGVIVTALLFGAMHGSLVRLIPLSLLGLLFGVAVQRSGSLFSSMIMHFVNNAVALGLTYFATGIPSLTVLGVPWLLLCGLGLGLLTWVLVRGFGPVPAVAPAGSAALPRQVVPAMALVLTPALLIYAYAASAEVIAVFRKAAPPPPTPPAQQTVAPEPLSYRLLIAGKEVTSTAVTLDSSDPLEVVLAFSAPMDRASTESVLKRTLPSGTALAWPDERTLKVTVPEGGTFDVDPTLARDAAGTRTLAGSRQSVQRPQATTLLLYKVSELMAGKGVPVYRHRVPQMTTGVKIAPDGETVLYYGADPMMGGVPPTLLHLPTGKLTPLGVPSGEYDTYSLGGWLPDGRLFLAGQKLYIGNGQGGDLKPVATVRSGWISVLSPTGEYLACWVPGPEGLVSLIDMRTGDVRQVQGPFRRGAQDGGVTLAWSPDGKLLAGTDHDSDIDGRGARIRIIDPFSGKQIRTIEDVGLRTWLPSGQFLGWEIRRAPEDVTVLFDTEGKRIDSFRGTASPSPDGRYLIVGRPDSQGIYRYHLVETATGAEQPLNLPGYPQWAGSGMLFIVSR